MTFVTPSDRTHVDAWTRAFAEDQARRAGMPLRGWLDQFISHPAVGVDDDEIPGDPDTTDAMQSRDGLCSEPAWEFARASDLAADWVDEADVGALFAVANADGALDASAEEPEGAHPRQTSDAARDEWLFEEIDAVSSGSDEPHQPFTASECEGDGASRELRAERDPSNDQLEHIPDDASAHVEFSPVARSISLFIDAGQRLDNVESEQMEVCKPIEAMVESQAREVLGTVADEVAAPLTPEPGQATVDAIERLGRDFAQLVEVVGCGFERIAHLVDELGSAIDQPERRASNALDRVYAEPLQAIARSHPASNIPQEYLGAVDAGLICLFGDWARECADLEEAGSPLLRPDPVELGMSADSSDFDLAAPLEDQAETEAVMRAPSDWPGDLADCPQISDSLLEDMAVIEDASDQVDMPFEAPRSPRGKRSIFRWPDLRQLTLTRKSARGQGPGQDDLGAPVMSDVPSPSAE